MVVGGNWFDRSKDALKPWKWRCGWCWRLRTAAGWPISGSGRDLVQSEGKEHSDSSPVSLVLLDVFEYNSLWRLSLLPNDLLPRLNCALVCACF